MQSSVQVDRRTRRWPLVPDDSNASQTGEQQQASLCLSQGCKMINSKREASNLSRKDSTTQKQLIYMHPTPFHIRTNQRTSRSSHLVYRSGVIIISFVLMMMFIVESASRCVQNNGTEQSSNRMKVLNNQHAPPPKKCTNKTSTPDQNFKISSYAPIQATYEDEKQATASSQQPQQFDDNHQDDNELYVEHEAPVNEIQHNGEPLVASDSMKHQQLDESSRYEPQVYATLNSFGHSTAGNDAEETNGDTIGEHERLPVEQPEWHLGDSSDSNLDDDTKQLVTERDREKELTNTGLDRLVPAQSLHYGFAPPSLNSIVRFDQSGKKSPPPSKQQPAHHKQRIVMKFLADTAPTLSQIVMRPSDSGGSVRRRREPTKVLPPVLVTGDMKVRSDVLVVKGDGKESADQEGGGSTSTAATSAATGGAKRSQVDPLSWDSGKAISRLAQYLPQRLVFNLRNEEAQEHNSLSRDTTSYDSQDFQLRPAYNQYQMDVRQGDSASDHREPDEPSIQTTANELPTEPARIQPTKQGMQRPSSSWIFDKLPSSISLGDLFSSLELGHGDRTEGAAVEQIGSQNVTRQNATLNLAPLKAQTIRVSADPNQGVMINRRGLIVATSKPRKPQSSHINHQQILSGSTLHGASDLQQVPFSRQKQHPRPLLSLAESTGNRAVNNKPRRPFNDSSDFELADKAGPPYLVTNLRHNSSAARQPGEESQLPAQGIYEDLTSSAFQGADHEVGDSQVVKNFPGGMLNSIGLQTLAVNRNSTSNNSGASNRTQTMFNHNPPYKQHLIAAANLASAAGSQHNGGRTNNSGSNKTKNYQQKTQLLADTIDRKYNESSGQEQSSITLAGPVNDPANTTVSHHLMTNSSGGNNSNYSQHLNHPNQHQHHNHYNNFSSAPTATSSSTPNRPAKIIDKLQHMITATILKNTQPPLNLTSLASALQPQWQSPSTSSTTPPSTSTPPPLLSTAVANNIANLIAQRLSFFARPTSPNHIQYFTTPSPLGSSALSTLGSLFSFRFPSLASGGSSFSSHSGSGSVQKFKNRVSPMISQAAHTTGLNRRTASMGSILVSGLLYGLSVLPALMALTGINPLSQSGSGAGGVSLAEPQESSTNQQSVRAASDHKHKRPAGNKRVRLNRLPLAGQPGYAYLVPYVHPSVGSSADSLDDETVPLDAHGANGDSAQPSALKSLYAPPPTIIGPVGSDVMEPEFNNLMEDEFGPDHLSHTKALLAPSISPQHSPSPQPMVATDSPLASQALASHLIEQYHPYSRFKGHLHYSRPLAPRSTSDWSTTEPSDSWQVGRSNLVTREPISTGGSARHSTFVSLSNSNRLDPNLKSTSRRSVSKTLVSSSPKLKKRELKSAQKLNYRPKPITSLPKAIKPHPTKLIEFQSVKDIQGPMITRNGNLRRSVKIAEPSGGARYNLNQSFKIKP